MQTKMTLEPLQQKNSNTTFAVFTLYGDYLIPFCKGMAWTQDLIYLLGLLGIPERTTRTTLNRMKNSGWFTVDRDGRQSRYILTKSGRDVLEQGRQRIFEPATVDWDEAWQVVVYSLPEELRAQRDEFRKKLVWFGFGSLAGGTWVAAHNRYDELSEIIVELGIEEHVALFSSRCFGTMSNHDIVARCWDLTELGQQYQAFINTWQPRLDDFMDHHTESELLSNPEFRYQESLWLTFDFQPFPRIDPNLPVALLPPDWSGHRARQIFEHYRQHLRLGLHDFFDAFN
ncbi:MAG: PaaX family transcriptional regulator C-terminal domain-containing protein [Chloroflexota bacterium]